MLRPRPGSRPSFDDLAHYLRSHGVAIPSGREEAEWEALLTGVPELVESWLKRAGPESARLVFAVSAVLDPPLVYTGGTLPRSIRQALTRWMDFLLVELFDNIDIPQPRSKRQAGAV